jgi:hypothetical protein
MAKALPLRSLNLTNPYRGFADSEGDEVANFTDLPGFRFKVDMKKGV